MNKRIKMNEAWEAGLLCMPFLAQVGICCVCWVFTVAVGIKAAKANTEERTEIL